MIPDDLKRHVRIIWEPDLEHGITMSNYDKISQFGVGLVLVRCVGKQALFVLHVFQEKTFKYDLYPRGAAEFVSPSRTKGYSYLKKLCPSMMNVSRGTWVSFSPADEALLKMFFVNEA